MTYVSDAAGQRRRRCARLVARGALRGGGSGGGVCVCVWGGARELFITFKLFNNFLTCYNFFITF